ncbi:GTP-binding protein [Pseudomonas sp. Marseille-QA0892]
MKILFIGPMGAGKTTAIHAVSDIPPVNTEADNTDAVQHSKSTTTVAMDYGEINLGEGDTVALYGIPGQDRFAFMWPILGEGAMGAVLLLDHSRQDRLLTLKTYLDAFPALADRGALVIAVGHTQESQSDVLPAYRSVLAERGLALPMFVTDVREKQNVLLLIETLIANAEVSQLQDVK